MERYAFESCESLEKITLSNHLTSIEGSAFWRTGITELSVPDSVTEIKSYAFGSCVQLVSVDLPDGITTLGYGAFYGCISLQSIILGSGLEEIDNNAFSDCPELNFVTIPSGVLTIGTSCFSSCTKLDTIEFLGDAPYIGDNSFSGDKLTAFYPSDNDTWDSHTMAEYGADSIEWKESCGSHSAGSAVKENETASTCTEQGSYDQVTYCTECGKKLSEETVILPLAAHKEAVNEGYEATCLCPGLTDEIYCEVCKTVIRAAEEIPVTGHLFTNYVYNNDATTQADGTETAYCDYGCGTSDTRTKSGTKISLATPELKSIANTTSGIKLTWGAVDGAAGYRVYRKTSGSNWAKVKDVTTESLTDTAADSGTTYTYTVRCLDTAGKRYRAMILQESLSSIWLRSSRMT